MKQITPEELQNRIESNQKITILDVRECWEHEEHCICTFNIPLAELPNRLKELDHLKGEEIIVHCQSGKRGNQAQKYLMKNGFQNVINLKGGLKGYLNELQKA